MITFPNLPNRDTFTEILSRGSGLTNAQKNRLQKEITQDPLGRGYAGKTPRRVMMLINLAFTTTNVVPPTTKPRTEIGPEEYARINRFAVDWFIDNPDERAAKPFEAESLAPALLTLPPGPPDAKRFRSITSQLIAAGALTDQQLNSVLLITDPKYREQVYNQPRAEALFGNGAYITIEDLAAVGVV